MAVVTHGLGYAVCALSTAPTSGSSYVVGKSVFQSEAFMGTATIAPAGTVKRRIGHILLPLPHRMWVYTFWGRQGWILQGC